MSSWASTALLVLGALTLLRWMVALLQEVQRAICIHILPRLTSKRFRQTYGEWAVVTGASDGIGKGYVRELAQDGMNVILVARNKDKLDKVAHEISSEFGVETIVIVADFVRGREIYAYIEQQLQGKDIGILVNNVGVFAPDILSNFGEDDVTMEDVWKTVNINVANVPSMTKIVLPGMLHRGRGAIINIASMASIVPMPMGALYSASKAFVDFFTQALSEECRGTGVIVQGVHPGMVQTNLTEKMKATGSIPDFVFPDTRTFCGSAVASIGHTDYTTGYWTHGVQTAMIRAMPRWLAFRVMKSENTKAREMVLKMT
ncbi:unnamed protein product, partial [Meganyctiphanes norvegica]